MKRYLVDLENVPLKKFVQAVETDKKDEVVLFYSNNTGCDFKSLSAIKGKIKFISCAVGPKNAMDLQIAMHIGMNVNRKQGEYIIISNDKGYDCLSKLNFDNVKISRLSVNNNNPQVAVPALTVVKAVQAEVIDIIKPISPIQPVQPVKPQPQKKKKKKKKNSSSVA